MNELIICIPSGQSWLSCIKGKWGWLVQFWSISMRQWIQWFALLTVQPQSILWSNTWSLLLRPIKRATHNNNNNKLPSGSALWLSQDNLMFIRQCFVSCAVARSVSFLHSPPLRFIVSIGPRSRNLPSRFCWNPADTLFLFLICSFSVSSISLVSS